jgi:hypothetical protein
MLSDTVNLAHDRRYATHTCVDALFHRYRYVDIGVVYTTASELITDYTSFPLSQKHLRRVVSLISGDASHSESKIDQIVRDPLISARGTRRQTRTSDPGTAPRETSDARCH